MRNEAFHLQQMMEPCRYQGKVPAVISGKFNISYLIERLSWSARLRKPVVLNHPKAQIGPSVVALSARLSDGSTAQFNNEGFFKKVVDWFF